MIVSRDSVRLIERALKGGEKGWEEIRESTFRRFAGTPEGRLMEMRYQKGKSWQAVTMELYIEKRTYHAWVKEIVLYAAFLAYKEGKIEI